MSIVEEDKILIGWEEWCALDQLNIPAIKAKVDTGATISALHAYDIKGYKKGDETFVRFIAHPLQGDLKLSIPCHAKVIDRRYIMSSNGHKEKRYVISTTLGLGEHSWDIELTLSNRDPLQFRMLLGREALSKKVLIDPARSRCQGSINKKELKALYQI